MPEYLGDYIMAIWTGLNHSPDILKAATAWRDICLQKEGSVFSNRLLWTKQNISQLKTLVVDHPIEDDRPFYEKLRAQIGNAAPEISQLAAEVIWILLLFVYEKRHDSVSRRSGIFRKKLCRSRRTSAMIALEGSQIRELPSSQGSGASLVFF